MKRSTKALAILALLPSLVFAGPLTWMDGVSFVDPNDVGTGGITIANTGCVNIKDAGGTAIGVLCLDANDDLFIGDATGVDNMVFDVATSGTFSFDVNGAPKVTISAIGDMTSNTMLSGGSAGLSTVGSTKYAINRLAIGRAQTYTIQTENLTADAATSAINITAQAALAAAVTNLDGGAVNVTGGAGASGSAGDAGGGNVVLTGGAAFGTGTAGLIQLINAGANTDPIAELENTAGDFQIFRTDATPESSVTGSIGDLAVDGTGGVLYIKNTGSASNTGWEALSTTDAYSSLWFHGAATQVAIANQNEFTKITIFVNEGAEDAGGNVVGDATTDDDLTVNLAGTYTLDIEVSATNSGGGAAEFHVAPKIILATAITISTASAATPIVVDTSAAHLLKTGDCIEISGVTNNANAIGDFCITVTDADTFTLQNLAHVDVAGSGAGTGGTVDTLVPGNIYVEQIVSNTDLGRGAAHGTVVLAVGDIIEATAVNQTNADELDVEQIQLGVNRIGN